MLNCTLIPAGDQQPATLQLGGEATIAHAQQLKDALVEALTGSPCLLVDCRGLDEADFSCLQLLCSAHRTFQRLRVTSGSHDVLAGLIADAGLDRFTGCCQAEDKQSCLWIRDESTDSPP
jgi:anti-anti-sigma regulatory factor